MEQQQQQAAQNAAMTSTLPVMDNKKKLEEYWKTKIKEVFQIFDTEKQGIVLADFIPNIMKYLGQFPSDSQWKMIISQELKDEEHADHVKYEKFEPYMLKVIENQEFEPNEADFLMAAFKRLDVDKKGFIEIDYLEEQLKGIPAQSGKEEVKGKGYPPFEESEWISFKNFATNNDPDATVIYYEDYVSRLITFVDKHNEMLMKGFQNFQVKKN